MNTFEDAYLTSKRLRFSRGRQARQDRVLSLEPLAEAYFSADLLVSYQGARNEDLYRGMLAAIEPDLWPARELRVQWNEQALTGFRIVQRNDHSSSHWILSEIQFHRNDDLVAADTRWDIRATPFPWTAGRIFDKNPLTAWNSGEPLYHGMAVEVTFPGALTINRAHCDLSLGTILFGVRLPRPKRGRRVDAARSLV